MPLKPLRTGRRVAEADPTQERILYVEDEDLNWTVTEFALREKYGLMRAASSREAFDLLRENEFDLILMDIQLAGSELNGIEITQCLRSQFLGRSPAYALGVHVEETPIVFVTAYSGRYDKAELMAAGGDDLITKPVDMTRLSLSISRLLARKARQIDERVEAMAHAAVDEGDRREHRRESFFHPDFGCQLLLGSHGYTGTVVNVSSGGARVRMQATRALDVLSLGTQCNIELAAIWGGLQMQCRVVRVCSRQPAELALKFLHLSSRATELLGDWLDHH